MIPQSYNIFATHCKYTHLKAASLFSQRTIRFARIANLLWQSAKSLNSNIMANFTQKELKQLVKNGAAIDATDNSSLIKVDPYWWIIGISKGKYGINGCLIYTSSGKLFAITKRSSSLFYFL